jgi:hypothetical protein
MQLAGTSINFAFSSGVCPFVLFMIAAMVLLLRSMYRASADFANSVQNG